MDLVDLTPAQREQLAESLRWIRPIARQIGVTRIADVTHMDFVGMPVVQAVRPRSKQLLVSQGKGLTMLQAEMSALMEAVELFHAEDVGVDVRASIGEMVGELGYDPEALSRLGRSPSRDVVLEWTRGKNLATGAPEYVPTDLVSMDFTLGDQPYYFPFRRTSNGLASGRTRVGAILHGLYEVIERHALSLQRVVPLELDRVPERAVRLAERIEASGLELSLEQLEHPTGVHCLRVFVKEPSTRARFWGSAARASKDDAFLGALTEALQSRLTVICGGRDDITEMAYRSFDATAHGSGRGSADATDSARERRSSYAALPTHAFESIEAETSWVLARLASAMGASPIVVDLTRPELGVPVTACIVPKLCFTDRTA